MVAGAGGLGHAAMHMHMQNCADPYGFLRARVLFAARGPPSSSIDSAQRTAAGRSCELSHTRGWCRPGWRKTYVTFCFETTCNRYISPGSRRTHFPSRGPSAAPTRWPRLTSTTASTADMHALTVCVRNPKWLSLCGWRRSSPAPSADAAAINDNSPRAPVWKPPGHLGTWLQRMSDWTS